MSEQLHTSIAEELRSGKTVTYFTVGVSMRPLLAERKTHVMIAPLDQAEKWDILLYVRENGAQVLHRCIKQDDRFYYMRGDNTCGLERIRREQAIGVATHIYRKGRCFDVKKNKVYRVYVAIWNLIYPFRWVLSKLKTVIRRLLWRKNR